MITEDYVSFETAKLLKEKGFKTPVETGYYGDGRICHNLALDFMDYNHEDGYYSRPTIQMAMKWLREVHDIFIKLEFDVDEDIQWHPSLALIKGNKYIHTNELQWYDTYEDACEAAIKYCLENLI